MTSYAGRLVLRAMSLNPSGLCLMILVSYSTLKFPPRSSNLSSPFKSPMNTYSKLGGLPLTTRVFKEGKLSLSMLFKLSNCSCVVILIYKDCKYLNFPIFTISCPLIELLAIWNSRILTPAATIESMYPYTNSATCPFNVICSIVRAHSVITFINILLYPLASDMVSFRNFGMFIFNESISTT